MKIYIGYVACCAYLNRQYGRLNIWIKPRLLLTRARGLIMSRYKFRLASRRRVLQFLAAGPLLTADPLAAFAQGLPARPPDPMVRAPRDPDNVITDPKQALDVFDFEPAAKKNLRPAHFGYMVTGADDDAARQSRGLPQIPAAPSPARRFQHDRHDDRTLRRPL